MGPQPLWSHLDYSGGGEGYYAFERLKEERLEVYMGQGSIPAFHAMIDPLRRQLRYENAMPHPAIVVRPNSARIFHLANEGRLRLEPGDVMVAFAGEIRERAVVHLIRENPSGRAALLVSQVLDLMRGTVVVVRFISAEVPALSEESTAMTLAVA